MRMKDGKRKRLNYICLMRWLRQLTWPFYVSLLFGILVTAWQWFAINPDGIAYSDIALKWSQGHVYYAINAYWSPFWSWLLAPFFWLGIKPLVAIHMLQLLLLFLALCDWRRWLSWLSGKSRPNWLPWLELAGGINLAYYAQAIAGPDLLATILFLHFLRMLISDGRSVYTGMLLGVMFLTKAYLFYFGLLATIIVLIYRVQQGALWAVELRRILKILCVSLLLFIPWIYLLHHKYGTLGVGSAGNYNALYRYPGGVEHPWKTGGLIAPPDPYSTFAWTDITNIHSQYQRLQRQKPASIASILSYNLVKSVRLLLFNCAFAFIALFFWLRHKNKKFQQWPRAFVIAALAGLYLAGYQLFSAEHRYFWPVFMLVNSLPVLWTDSLPKNKLFTGMLCLLTTIPHSLFRGFFPRNGLDEYTQSTILIHKIPEGSRIASWHTRQSWFISFFNRYHDYGGLAGNGPHAYRLAAERHRIQYVLFTQSDLTAVKAAFPDQAIDSIGTWYYLKLK